MEEKISIKRENVMNAYKRASKEQKALLENMFGKDMFKPKNIMERVKTFEDACAIIGDNHTLVKEYFGVVYNNIVITKNLIAYLKLRIICEALNEGWKPQYTEKEYRWCPWFRLWTEEELNDKSEEWKTDNKLLLFGGSSNDGSFCGLTCAYTADVVSLANADQSARLSVKSEELAAYFGKQFIDIWSDYLFA